MNTTEVTRRISRPLLIPLPDINSPQEENFAANKYLYDVATFAMYNRIQGSRYRQRLFYGYNNHEDCNPSQCKKSLEDFSTRRIVTNEAINSFENLEKSSRIEQESEDDYLQFSIEI